MILPLKKLTNLNERKEKLTKLAENILSKYKDHLEPIQKQLGLSNAEAIKHYLAFDLDPVFSNEIYNSLPLRFVMYMHLFLDGSWHQTKQNLVCKLLKKYNLQDIVDLGFGIPFQYVFHCIRNKINITLNDIDPHAIEFAKIVLSVHTTEWESFVSFLEGDLSQANNYAEKGETFLFLDSIEHAHNPTPALKEYVQLSSLDSIFILSIPVSQYKHDGHSIYFETIESALKWAQASKLEIIEKFEIETNKEVDLFAEPMDFCIKDVLIVCKRY